MVRGDTNHGIWNLLDEAGIYVDEAANGVFLPAPQHQAFQHSAADLTKIKNRLINTQLQQRRNELKLIGQEILAGTF